MKKAIILCNGEPPVKNQVEELLTDQSLFIAADGGADIAKSFGLLPDLVIGDLDSYNPAAEDSFPVIHDPDQETNDLEKALNYALKQNISEAIVFGATGLRIDQTLKNLSVLKQFRNRFRSLIFRDTICDILLPESPFRKVLPAGTTVSLFPLSGRVDGITTKGLRYSLDDETLENGVRDGSSNESREPEVVIEFKKGDLLVIINHTV